MLHFWEIPFPLTFQSKVTFISIPLQPSSFWTLEGWCISTRFCTWLLEEEFHRGETLNAIHFRLTLRPGACVQFVLRLFSFFLFAGHCTVWTFLPPTIDFTHLRSSLPSSQVASTIRGRTSGPTELQFTRLLLWMQWIFSSPKKWKKGNLSFWRGRGLCVKKLSLPKVCQGPKVDKRANRTSTCFVF